MAITDALQGFPVINQINERADSGRLEINDNDDCVPCSTAACLTQLTGVHHTGSELKDAVYGIDYRGVTDPARYIDYAARLGVQMTVEYGEPAQLVALIHQAIAAGHPILVTMPWPWDRAAEVAQSHPLVQTYGITHEGAACGVGDGWIRVMNPWGGFFQDQPDSWWQARLCYGKVYVLKKVGVPAGQPPVQVAGGHQIMTLSLADPVVSRYFKQEGDGWRCLIAPNALIRAGMLQFYQTVPAPGSYAGISLLGLPQTDEIILPDHQDSSVTLFERGLVAWDPHRHLDQPPGVSGAAYLMHHEQLARYIPSATGSGGGDDPAAAAEATVEAVASQVQELTGKLDEATRQLQDALTQRAEALNGQNAAAEEVVQVKQQAQQQISDLQAQVEAAQAALPSADSSAKDTEIERLTAAKAALEQELLVAKRRMTLAELALNAPTGELPVVSASVPDSSTLAAAPASDQAPPVDAPVEAPPESVPAQGEAEEPAAVWAADEPPIDASAASEAQLAPEADADAVPASPAEEPPPPEAPAEAPAQSTPEEQAVPAEEAAPASDPAGPASDASTPSENTGSDEAPAA
jgi:hypothetical protein